jgi:ribosomal 30S subunit maturation factor RimM|nr:rRNA processing protein RimM [Candidatus Cloacimonadota bacterium]
MNAPHLIGIGRLGGTDSEGWHHVMIKPSFRAEFDHIVDLYLIFEENRVFYVTISDRKQSDKKTLVKFAEDGVAEERRLHKEVILAIEDQDYQEEEEDISFIGLDVVYNEQMLGCVVDKFFNGAQDVLVISTALDVEIMVPMVDYYLSSLPEPEGVIFLQNMEELLFASGLKMEAGQLMALEDES